MRPRYLALSLALAAGCNPPPTSDLLRVSFGAGELAPPVEVDTLCANGGCEGREQLEATLEFLHDDLVDVESTVEILQYKVEYALFVEDEALAGAVPYYANHTSVTVGMGEAASFNVRAVGDAQRDWIFENFGRGQIDGTGTLTLAGYDHANELVEVSVDFDVLFGDFIDDTAPPEGN